MNILLRFSVWIIMLYAILSMVLFVISIPMSGCLFFYLGLFTSTTYDVAFSAAGNLFVALLLNGVIGYIVYHLFKSYWK